jgi:hypothetical protein
MLSGTLFIMTIGWESVDNQLSQYSSALMVIQHVALSIISLLDVGKPRCFIIKRKPGIISWRCYSSVPVVRFAIENLYVILGNGYIKVQPDDVNGCGRNARGGHGLPKVSPGPATPYHSMPCGQATPGTVLQLFQGWSASRAGGLRQSSTLLDTPRRAPMMIPTRWRQAQRRSCPQLLYPAFETTTRMLGKSSRLKTLSQFLVMGSMQRRWCQMLFKSSESETSPPIHETS